MIAPCAYRHLGDRDGTADLGRRTRPRTAIRMSPGGLRGSERSAVYGQICRGHTTNRLLGGSQKLFSRKVLHQDPAGIGFCSRSPTLAGCASPSWCRWRGRRSSAATVTRRSSPSSGRATRRARSSSRRDREPAAGQPDTPASAPVFASVRRPGQPLTERAVNLRRQGGRRARRRQPGGLGAPHVRLRLAARHLPMLHATTHRAIVH
jgi:hypothetical protein